MNGMMLPLFSVNSKLRNYYAFKYISLQKEELDIDRYYFGLVESRFVDDHGLMIKFKATLNYKMATVN